MIEVVHVLKVRPKFGTLPGDVYIGRYNSRYGFPQSKWHNPFPMRDESERDMVITQYEKYLFDSGLINDICELKNAKRLGCWCKPARCHGDILKKYILERCYGHQEKLLRKSTKSRCKCKRSGK
jgi:hypothetical protein